MKSTVKQMPTWAATIIKQLNGAGVGRLVAMLGTKSVTFSEKDKRVEFDYQGCKKSNKVLITLTPDDLYDVAFWKIPTVNAMMNGKIPVEVSRHEGLYWDQLRETFQGQTGLYVKL